ncbi:MAG: glycosyltransferase family 4 protein, partial [Candidatus Auribacterota bacterium]|nr:glycosyltransferase family 4 protein [Candidatus Auribacterota bacterium]
EDSTGYYAKILTEAGLLDRVRFVGPHRDISQFYNAADIFVFPTLYEPFGTVVVEAMGRGLPVVVSRSAGAAELITPGREGYLIEDPEDPEEIAKLIGRIRQQGITRFSGAALKTAGKSTWADRTAELMAIYRDCRAINGNDFNCL